MGLFSKKIYPEFDYERVYPELEKVLGKHDHFYKSPKHFLTGFNKGGRTNLFIYDNHVEGVAYLTASLFGQNQKESDAGNYELMICHKNNEEDWGPILISCLAYYTLDSSINSGETMELEGGPFSDDSYTIKHILFNKYAEFDIDEKKYGIMLLIGITQKEWEWKQENTGLKLLEILKNKNVYPYTDLYRDSVI